MPIYEYACQACGHEVEAIQKFSDPALTDCPACQKPELRKRISAAGFQLKGKGWYVTDFRGGSKGKDKEKEKDKTESKPAESTADKKPGGCGSGGCGCH